MHTVSDLDQLRRRLTPPVRPAPFAFTRVEAMGPFPERRYSLRLGVSAPIKRLHARLFKSQGDLAIDLGPAANLPAGEGKISTAQALPTDLDPGPYVLVLEGEDTQARVAGCEISVTL